MILALGLALLLSQSHYTADEAKAVFAQAADASSKGDHKAAQAGFAKLAEHGFGGADVLFNLGTSYLAAGELGPAVLYLERARRLSPGDDDIEANLKAARQRQMDQLNGQEGGPFLQRFVDSTSPVPWAVAFWAFWTLGFACLIARRFKPSQPVLLLGAIAFLVFSIPLGAGLAVHAYVGETFREAVVMSPTVAAKDLPKDQAKTAFEVHTGLKVRVMDEADGYVKFRLSNGLEGWARKDDVAEI